MTEWRLTMYASKSQDTLITFYPDEEAMVLGYRMIVAMKPEVTHAVAAYLVSYTGEWVTISGPRLVKTVEFYP